MHMRAGGHAGRSDETDHLALPHPLADFQALGEGGHVPVRGLVSIVVLDANVFSVTAFPADFLDQAVARCKNRSAIGRGPVDAGVHLEIAEDGMAPSAEARAHDRVVDRFAYQELLRTLSGLVVVVDHRVIGSLEAIIFLGFSADRQRSKQHIVLFGNIGAFVFAGVEDVEGVARLHLALEIDVIGVNPDHVFDHGRRHLIAERGFVNALIKPHTAAVVIIVVAIVGRLGNGVHALHVHGDVFAKIG